MKQLKNLLLILAMILMPASMAAQQAAKKQQTKKSSGPGYVIRTISPKLNIEDKIIVKNESSDYLTEVGVFLIDRKGKYVRLGTARNLSRNETAVVKSYSDDKLANLKGRRLAISVKARKHKRTSSFEIELDDHRHDLYIEIDD